MAESYLESPPSLLEDSDTEFLIEEISLLREQINGLKRQYAEDKLEKRNLHRELEERRQHAEQQERVIRSLRERQEETQLEANQLQEDLQKIQVAFFELSEAAKTCSLQQQAYHALAQEEKSAKQAALEEIETLYMQFELLKKEFSNSKQLWQEKFQIKEEHIVALENKLKDQEEQHNASLSEYQVFAAEVLRMRQSHEEHEESLKTAQQHLAKKVKLISDLNEQLQSYEQTIEKMQAQLAHLQSQKSEQQQLIEALKLQEIHLSDKLAETTCSVDTLNGKWEEKYFKIYEKWQESELQIKELKRVEERYAQMQVFATNIMGLFSSNFASDLLPLLEKKNKEECVAVASCATLPKDLEIEKSPIVQEISSVTKSPYKNLFDMFAKPAIEEHSV